MIKWKNYEEKDNNWEPLVNLQHCKDLVEEFERNLANTANEDMVSQEDVPQAGQSLIQICEENVPSTSR